MNTVTKVFLLTISTATFLGCQGNSTTTNSVAANSNSATNISQTNSYVASNGETMQPAFNDENKNAANALQNSANAKVANAENNRMAQQSEPITELPAADNSTYAAEMNGSGQPVETRTFKNHPILVKVEKITLSPRDYIFKVYLKNGKVVESKSEELKQFRYIAPINILEAIGAAPPKPTPDPNDPTRDGKKKQIMIPSSNQ